MWTSKESSSQYRRSGSGYSESYIEPLPDNPICCFLRMKQPTPTLSRIEVFASWFKALYVALVPHSLPENDTGTVLRIYVTAAVLRLS